MKNFLEILERHVQWIVLGLARLYFCYMAYAYLLVPPVTAEVDGAAMPSAEIDRKTLDAPSGPAARLKKAIDSRETPSFEVSDYVEPFKKRMEQMVPTPPYELARVIIPSYGARAIITADDPTKRPQIEITELVALPKPVLVGNTSGKSYVAITKPDNTITNSDKFWVSVGASITSAKLVEEWDRTKLSKIPQVPHTALLLVELEREELMPDGSWSNRQTIKPLSISKLPAWPKDVKAQFEYSTWANIQENALAIQLPPFYATAAGDPWKSPLGDVDGAIVPTMVPANMPEIDRTRPPPAGIPDDLRRKWYIEHQKWKEEMRRATPPRQPAPRNPRDDARERRGGQVGLLGVDADGRQIQYAQNRTTRPPPNTPGGQAEMNLPLVDDAPPPGYTQPYYRPNQPGPDMRPPDAPPPPPGTALGGFVPANGMQDIKIMAHDDSALPGKTYRYRITYRMRNPLFGTKGYSNPPKLADQFDIASSPSDWSQPVTIEQTMRFAVAAGILGTSDKVDFVVYRWHTGRWNKSRITRSAGDAIAEGGIDTGATVVEVRTEPRSGETYVLVALADGQLARMSWSNASSDKTLERIRIEAEQAATPVPAAAGH